MSQLIAPTHTLADNIPLGRRITEIMTEKGPAYTIAAMAKRLEINRETLRLMLKGEREIYTFELEKIAQDLKVPVERILQSDIAEIREKVKAMIIRNDRAEQFLTLELAKKAASVSIGLTERCIGENEISCVYNNLKQEEVSYQILKNILPDAELILEKYNETEIYLWVICNLISQLVIRKDYVNLPKMIAKAEPHFSTNPRVGGMICYSMGKFKEEVEGDYQGARDKYLQSLEYYSRVSEEVTVARAKLVLGLFEYRQANYQIAEKYFQSVMPIFQSQRSSGALILTTLYYGKLLIRLGRFSDAVHVLLLTLEIIESATNMDFTEFAAHANLFLSIAANDPLYAERIINSKVGTISVQKIALKFLIEYFENIGNQVNRTKFELIAKQLRGSPIDVILPHVGTGPDALLSLFDLCHLHGWHLTQP